MPNQEWEPPNRLIGGGKMGKYIESSDWSLSALGPIADWSENLLNTLRICSHSPYPVALYWGDAFCIWYNDAWSELVGISDFGALGKPAQEALPELWKSTAATLQHVVAHHSAADLYLTINVPVKITFTPLFNDAGTVTGVFGTVILIHKKTAPGKHGKVQKVELSDQKIAEEQLAHRKALLEAHIQASVEGILLVDAAGKIISYNQRFLEVWNMPQEIMDSKDDEAALTYAMGQLVNPQQFIERVKYLYNNPSEKSIDELEYKDGKIVERNGYAVLGEDGSYFAWSWTFRDVTKQKTYERAIKQSEERFRTLAETIPQLVWVTDENGAQEYASKRWKEYTGIEPRDAGSWEQMVHPADFKNISKATSVALL